MFVVTYVHIYICNIMCQKSHVSTKYAQTFATSALLYTHTLLSTCKESGIAQHKSNNSLSMLCSPLSHLQDNTRANAGVAAVPSVSYPCGRWRTLIRNAFGTSLSVLSCFCLFSFEQQQVSLSLSPSLASLVFRLLLLVPPGPDTVLAVRRRVFVSFLVCAVRRRSG